MREQGQQKQRAGPDDAAGTEVRTAGTAVFYFFLSWMCTATGTADDGKEDYTVAVTISSLVI